MKTTDWGITTKWWVNKIEHNHINFQAIRQSGNRQIQEPFLIKLCKDFKHNHRQSRQVETYCVVHKTSARLWGTLVNGEERDIYAEFDYAEEFLIVECNGSV